MFPPLTYDDYGFAFGWTLLSIIITWGGVGIMYSDNYGAKIFLSIIFALEGIFFSVAVIIYLFRALLDHKYSARWTKLGGILGLLDVWMALLTSQAAVLYISYIYWPSTSFSVDLSGAPNGPYFVFLQIIYIMAVRYI